MIAPVNRAFSGILLTVDHVRGTLELGDVERRHGVGQGILETRGALLFQLRSTDYVYGYRTLGYGAISRTITQ